MESLKIGKLTIYPCIYINNERGPNLKERLAKKWWGRAWVEPLLNTYIVVDKRHMVGYVCYAMYDKLVKEFCGEKRKV